MVHVTLYRETEMLQNKNIPEKTRLMVQYNDHPRFMTTSLSALMEHGTLVDMVIRVGNQSFHAHKVILAANSPFFKEQLQINPQSEQVIVNGMECSTMRCIIEFIYCGETTILEEKLKYVVAAAKLFQIRGLQAIGSEAPGGDEMIYYPPPIFINQKPKYSSTNYMSPYPDVDDIPKNKMITEDNNDYPSDFNLNSTSEYMPEIDNLPIQVVEYADINSRAINTENNMSQINVFDVNYSQERNYERDMGDDLAIMYKTPGGQYVNVSNETYQQTLARENMQYHQVLGVENGRQNTENSLNINTLNIESDDLPPSYNNDSPIGLQIDINTTDDHNSENDSTSGRAYNDDFYHPIMEPDESSCDGFIPYDPRPERIDSMDAIHDLEPVHVDDLSGNCEDINCPDNYQDEREKNIDKSVIMNEDPAFMEYYDHLIYDNKDFPDIRIDDDDFDDRTIDIEDTDIIAHYEKDLNILDMIPSPSLEDDNDPNLEIDANEVDDYMINMSPATINSE